MIDHRDISGPAEHGRSGAALTPDDRSPTITAVRALSQETGQLVDELHRATRADTAVALLARIARNGEPLAVPRIVSLVLDDRPAVALAAERVVAALRRRVEPRALGAFDRAFRNRSAFRADQVRWQQLHPEEVRSLAARPSGPILVQLATCHPRGHVREEAIRCCAVRDDGTEVPFLLLRANDWVRPVAEVARSALRARLDDRHLDDRHLPDLIAALPMLDEMYRWGRLGSLSILHDIEAALASQAGLAAVIAATSSPDRFIRRSALRRLLERSPAAPELVEPAPVVAGAVDSSPYRRGWRISDPGREAAAAALGDPDPAIRNLAGRALLVSRDEVFLAFSAPLLASRMSAVRFGAVLRLRALGRILPWRDLLLDDHAGVRGLAQEAALDADIDPAEEYRRALSASDDRRLGPCLIGLAETGSVGDAVVVRTYRTHRLAVVRRSCLRALARWQPEEIVELCLDALGDPSPRVTHAARDLLLARSTSVHPEELWARLDQLTAGSGKRDALTVLAHSGYWQGLPYLLRAFRGSDGPLKATAAR
ncbi:MAG: hypothetical protein E6J91_33615 [Deltaproteobacteria bacterium]|nr:MAG: hypothetical protein E6J91_33615 [Deltaproteobacteria bacterium]